jgi:hypothetical protein
MNEGWRCPGCGRCYSPLTAACPECAAFRVYPQITQPQQPAPLNSWRCASCGSDIPFGVGHGCGVYPGTAWGGTS